jgi:hypothetical protein
VATRPETARTPEEVSEMSVENLTSVVTDPYHVTDPEHGFTVHDPGTVAFVFAPAFPATAPGA